MNVDTSRRAPRRPPEFLNKIIAFLLRSPLHSLISNQLLLLTFQGRKSGKSYTIPVGYMQQGKNIMLFTDHNWWKNLRDHAPVRIYLKGKKRKGTAEVILDKEVIAEGLRTFVQQHPDAAGAYEVKFDSDGQPNRETVDQAAERFKVIRISLT